MRRCRLGLIGFGNVARGLIDLLLEKQRHLEQDLGLSLQVTAVSDMRLGFAADPEGLKLSDLKEVSGETGSLATLPNGQHHADNAALLESHDVDVVIELTFTNPDTGEPALSHIKTALSHRKHVVTSNKGPVALFGGQLRSRASQSGLAFRYEGSVMSGTPVLRLAREALSGASIQGFRGILNGTANYILGQVEAGVSFSDALSTAQANGFAEADPTADIAGSDVFAKVKILSGEFFGYGCEIISQETTGIDQLPEADIRSAVANSQRWKLIGEGVNGPDGVRLAVRPVPLALDDPLAGVAGVQNAVTFETDVLGQVTVQGPGAGRVETAFALLSDILDIHRNACPRCYMIGFEDVAP